MIEIVALTSISHLIVGLAQLLQGRCADGDKILRGAISLESDLAEACYCIGLTAIALGSDNTAQLQYKRLTELDRRLADKLIEHRRRANFTPAEVINCLLE